MVKRRRKGFKKMKASNLVKWQQMQKRKRRAPKRTTGRKPARKTRKRRTVTAARKPRRAISRRFPIERDVALEELWTNPMGASGITRTPPERPQALFPALQEKLSRMGFGKPEFNGRIATRFGYRASIADFIPRGGVLDKIGVRDKIVNMAYKGRSIRRKIGRRIGL